MKSYRRKDNLVEYSIAIASDDGSPIAKWDGRAKSIDKALEHCREKVKELDGIKAKVCYVAANGKALPDWDINDINGRLALDADDSLLSEYEDNKWKVDECDGGGDAGGGAAGVGGDAAALPAAADIGDTAGEMAGTSTAEVLGVNEPGKGFFGKDNFYIPSRAKFPVSRFPLANGGSKRKKDKNGKDKKYAYEKGMKVVVDMFEDEAMPTAKKAKVLKHLKNIAQGVKSMDDVEAVQQKFEKDGAKLMQKLDSSKYKDIKKICLEFADFIKDICKGNYKASWFAVTMVAVGLIYLLSPVDVIPDVIPGIGIVDDAFVLMLIYNAIKDELEQWKAKKSTY